jgi:hypothetical protein
MPGSFDACQAPLTHGQIPAFPASCSEPSDLEAQERSLAPVWSPGTSVVWWIQYEEWRLVRTRVFWILVSVLVVGVMQKGIEKYRDKSKK